MSSNKGVISKPWQDLGSNSKGKYLLDTGLMADCSFLVGEGANAKRFNCHKIILISTSPYFEKMFCGNFKEANTTNPIPITYTQPADFRLFLEFIYDPRQSSAITYCDERCSDDETESIYFKNYNFETLKNLFNLSNMYMIKSLGRQCCLALQQQLNSGNEESTLRIFELAVKMEHKGLAKKSAQHFEENFRIDSCEQIYYLDASILCEFIKCLVFVSSLEILEKINIYIERNSLKIETNDDNEYEYGISKSCENPYQRKKNDLSSGQLDDQINLPICSNITNESADRKRKLEIVKNLYESVNFKDMDPLEFIEAAKEPRLSKYLTYRRKYEILGELCKKSQKARFLL